MANEAPNLTQLLVSYSNGDEDALSALLPKVYRELRVLASRYMLKERSGHTLQPTALVNEALLKLMRQKGIQWESRQHFFASAAQAMRRILTDHAKAKYAQKRGGANVKISFDEALHWEGRDNPNLVALDEALNELAKMNERQARIVELRYYAGLSVEETAEVLQISPATVKRDWVVAKTWLFQALQEKDAA